MSARIRTLRMHGVEERLTFPDSGIPHAFVLVPREDVQKANAVLDEARRVVDDWGEDLSQISGNEAGLLNALSEFDENTADAQSVEHTSWSEIKARRSQNYSDNGIDVQSTDNTVVKVTTEEGPMTLVERLRDPGHKYLTNDSDDDYADLHLAAADRIEALEAALREPTEKFAHMVVVHEAWCGKPLLGGCTCTLSQWHDWRSRTRELLKSPNTAFRGQAE